MNPCVSVLNNMMHVHANNPNVGRACEDMYVKEKIKFHSYTWMCKITLYSRLYCRYACIGFTSMQLKIFIDTKYFSYYMLKYFFS